MGREGLKELAEMNLSKCEYAKRRLAESAPLRFPSPTFNEFVLTLKGEPEPVLQTLFQQGIIGGLSLEKFYPELKKEILICVTEKHSREDIDRLARFLREAVGG
jgi:glycine dehydrogenase subunit 1